MADTPGPARRPARSTLSNDAPTPRGELRTAPDPVDQRAQATPDARLRQGDVQRPSAPKSTSRFSRFARATARATGRPSAFGLAALVILVWAITGPIFGFSDTWQLVINTGTTIVTFLMVFLIQNTQDRDAEAVQVKLDELIRATLGAHNTLLNLEDMEGPELDEIRKRYAALAEQAQAAIERGQQDTDAPDVG